MDEELYKIRHTTAHILACAVRRLYPGAQVALGPVTEDGFFYDFKLPSPLSEADFPKIEKEMQEIMKKGYSVQRSEVSIEEAKKIFKDEPFKLVILEEIESGKRSDLGLKGKVSLYTIGEFTDLCKGPHVENTGELCAFALLSVSGAYFQGKDTNPMLTRVHGTAFATKKELDAYLTMLEEAKKRDHKKLGKELDIFTFSELVGSGLPLWTPKGTLMRALLDEYVWSLRKTAGYERVEIPHITKKDLYEKSGHWDKFKDELFKIKTREGHEFAMKPMNCPHHTQIFARRQWSYRDMPQRYANTTMCYRDEQSGELSGLSRVRSFTQDDAHVFCRASQVEEEFLKIWDIVQAFYASFGFNLKVRVSLHDPQKKELYLGSEERWREAEETLRKIAKEKNADYFEGIGEAAFYGPKLDFMAKDSLGRQWQVATIQLDMNMPERFDLYCINEKGDKERVVMIHAAIMGSIERFMSILIEHTGGVFPLWLAPVQLVLMPVSEKHVARVEEIAAFLRQGEVRVQVWPHDTLGRRIREAALQKVPYFAIIGDKELEHAQKNHFENQPLSLRSYGSQDTQQSTVGEFIQLIRDVTAKKNIS